MHYEIQMLEFLFKRQASYIVQTVHTIISTSVRSSYRLHSGWSQSTKQLSYYQFRAFFNDPTCYEMETFVFQSCLCAVALLGRKERGAIKSSMCSTCPWKRPASCTVLSGLFSCSYVLLMYLFHSRVSLSAGISNSLLISFSIVSANRGRQGDRLIDWLDWRYYEPQELLWSVSSPAESTKLSPMVSALLKCRVTTLSMLSFSHKLSSSR